MGVHVVTGDETEAAGGIENSDVDALHLQGHDLGLSVVVPLDGEVHTSGFGQAGAG